MVGRSGGRRSESHVQRGQQQSHRAHGIAIFPLFRDRLSGVRFILLFYFYLIDTRTHLCYRALLYGGIGVEISSAILSSVYPPGVAYGKDGVLLTVHSVAVNRSIGATAEARACFGHFVKGQQMMEVENNTVLTGMLSISSVQYALEVR